MTKAIASMARMGRNRLASGAAEAAEMAAPLAILVLAGSFCPVHTRHIEAICVARKTLEARGIHVVLGMLLPCIDELLSAPVEEGGIPLVHRNRMLELAAMPHDWIDVSPWGWANRDKAIQGIEALMRQHFEGHHFRAYRIVDVQESLENDLWQVGHHLVCVGSSLTIAQVWQKQRDLQRQIGLLKGKDSRSQSVTFHLGDGEVEEERSAEIRTKMEAGEWQDLVDEELMEQDVTEYLYRTVKRSRSPWRRCYTSHQEPSKLRFRQRRKEIPTISSARTDCNPIPLPKTLPPDPPHSA